MKKFIILLLLVSLAFGAIYLLGGCDDTDGYFWEKWTNGGNDAACDHSWGNWAVVSQATCTRSGEMERTCDKCGQTETTTIAALGHNFVNGKCTDCGARNEE